MYFPFPSGSFLSTRAFLFNTPPPPLAIAARFIEDEKAPWKPCWEDERCEPLAFPAGVMGSTFSSKSNIYHQRVSSKGDLTDLFIVHLCVRDKDRITEIAIDLYGCLVSFYQDGMMPTYTHRSSPRNPARTHPERPDPSHLLRLHLPVPDIVASH
jgi:hypothetical protein